MDNIMLNKMEKIEKIRLLCIKKNPSINTLETGCVVKEFDTGLLYRVGEIFNSGNITLRGLTTPNHLNPDIVKGKLELVGGMAEFLMRFEVLGRPIRLSDLLLVIGEIGTEVTNLLFLYDVKEDDLYKQDEKLLNFLCLNLK